MTTLDTIQLDQLDARIRSVWVREQKLHLFGGLLALCRWAVPLFLLFVVIDWLTYMPTSGRVVMLLVLLGVSLQRAWAKGWRELRSFNAVGTALKIEATQSDLNSLLVSAIQLRDQAPTGDSSAMRQHTCQLAEQAASSLHPQQTVPYLPLRNPGYLALSAAGLIVIFGAVNAPFLAAGLSRIFTPWVDVEYPTDTQIVLEQDALVIKEGDSAEISALLEGVVPDNAIIAVRTGDSRPRNIDMEVVDDRCTYNIASASRDFSYRIKAGDDRTKWHNVRVIPSPRIERAEVQLNYPEYLGRASDTIEALTLTAPEGSGIQWNLTLDRPVSAAQFIRVGEEPIDLPVSEDGLSVTFSEKASASQGYNFAWVEKENGYRFTSPRYYLQVASDQAPRVELTSPESNLVAMIGRPMELAVRAQDDHGIGSAQIVYRINQLDEAAFEIDAAEQGQGEQTLDWDYREALTDLAVGDTVSLTIQVSDKYPGANGPHTVRSDSRRITFLSKKDYLEQIARKKDRLLSRVQTIYRQQRSAHSAVLDLSPKSEGYLQACQLEAIRQEMFREQLKEIAGGLQALLDDLAANNVADAVEAESLQAVRTALIDIAETHIARAANQLREQSTGDEKTHQATRADHTVNMAARGLGSLVLLRGIEAAQEVYARESSMLAQSQATLRWLASTGTSNNELAELAQRQDELAKWTDELIAELQAGMKYDRRPLAVLRLIRSVKDLKSAGTSAKMREAGSLMQQDQTPQAMKLQAKVIRHLLDAEFSVRLSGAYSTMLRTRDQLSRMARVQTQLQQQTNDQTDKAFGEIQAGLTKQQTQLRRELLTLMLPAIPAPRPMLFDEMLPQVPPVEQLIDTSDQAMANALAAINQGNRQEAGKWQAQAGVALAELTEIVARRTVEVGLETQGLSTLVAAVSDRLSRIESLEARLISLLEQTDLAALDEKSVVGLAEEQLLISEEMAAFRRELAQQNESEADPDLPPLLSPLADAEKAANAAVQSLKDNNADEAIGHQDASANALAKAYEIAIAQNERLALLQSLLMFQRSVGFANGYMADIVAEQRDLLEATEAAKPEAIKVMLPQFAHMRQSMEDVAPLLTLVASRLDVGTPLAFAQTDFEDAIAALETGDQFEAIDAQDVAAESLADVQSRVADVQSQTGYVAEVVAFLHATTSDLAILRHEQAELRGKLQAADSDALKALAEEQNALQNRAGQVDRVIEVTAGQPRLVLPAEPRAIPPLPERMVPAFTKTMPLAQDAAKQLAQGDASAADEAMKLTATTLADNTGAFLVVIEMLEGLPQVTIDSQAEPALVRLVDVLALASDQRLLSRTTRSASAQGLSSLAKEQEKLAAQCKAAAANGQPHPLLDQANKELADALTAFAASDQEKLAQHQQAADTCLRHFIVEQSIILNTKIPPPSSSDAPAADGPGSDAEAEVTSGFISDFVSGETPGDQRSEWKVLGERNRAALNQNFARELPLEYRSLLKDYYERVAK